MKSPERERKLLTILDGAWGKAPDDLNAYLDAECGGDASLSEEVLALLASQRDDPQYMESPAQFAPPGGFTGEDAPPPALNLSPGQRLDRDRYEVVELIGVGGMGEIYKAVDLELERPVVLKLLLKGFRSDRGLSAQLLQEARVTSKLNHPNIVHIYNILKEGGTPILVLEYVAGRTLRDLIQKLKLSEALNIAIQVAEALDAADKREIVHCDITPGNIMVCDGGLVKVLDFGVAVLRRQQEEQHGEARPDPGGLGAGEIRAGTLKYMSPEQLVTSNDSGRGLDRRTDIYSLGVVLYEMVARRHPFAGSRDVVASIIADEPAPLSQYRPDVPPKLEWIVSKALRKKESRYQTARDLINDLELLKSEVESKEKLSQVKLLVEQLGGPARRGSPIQADDPCDLIKPLPPGPVPGTLGPRWPDGLLPFDLCTVCGLERGSFVSVVAGSKGDRLFENLIHAEQCLREMLRRRQGEGPSLPNRLWITIDPSEYRIIPGDKSELSSITSYPAEAQPAHRPSVVPGVFIELQAAEVQEALLVSIKAWCDTLINRTFSGEQVAVVVHVIDGRPGEAAEAVERVARRLRQVTGPIPLDVFTSAGDAGRPPEPEAAADEDADGDDEGDPWAERPSFPPGYHFRAWVIEATKAVKERHREKVQANYGKVIHLHQSLRELCEGTKPRRRPSTAHEVVRDLDAVAHLNAAAPDGSSQPLVPDGLDGEFLNFIGDYMPAGLEELLRAYVGSTRECARRAAVVCAVKRGLPGAAWGDDLTEQLALSAGEPADPEAPENSIDSSWLDAHANVGGSIINPMTLELLRRYVRNGEGEVEPLVVELSRQPGLGAGVKAVCDLALGRTGLKDFMRDNGGEAYALALRAGALSADSKFALSPGDIAEELSLDNPDLWALLAAMPTDLGWLSALLGMDKRHRAITGLITAEEWDSLRPDEFLLEKVLAARQGRPLYFRN